MTDVRVFGTAAALAAALVDVHVEAMARASSTLRASSPEPGLSIALTGGSAANLYEHLALAALPWDRVHVFFGDERCVPPTHADSNYKLAREKLLSRVPIPEANVHRMRGEDEPRAAATAYEDELVAATDGGAIDVLHLGMGPDGHVCSLFPGHALLDPGADARLVASLDDSPKPPASRVTLTLAAIAKAKRALFIVMGEGKASAVRAAIQDPSSPLPAAIVHRMGRATWLLDEPAASKLDRTSTRT